MTPEDMTVLIVDDESDIVDATSVAFELSGFNTLTANSGREAWDILNKKTVDIIITDIRMPDGSGLVLLDNVKAKNLYFPEVILVSGYADFLVEEIFEKGADALFWKPYDAKKLLSHVQKKLLSAEEEFSEKPETTSNNKISVNQSSLVNFGRGGFSVQLESDLPEVEDEIEFIIPAPEAAEISEVKGVGRVRWVRKEIGDLPLGAGVEFLYLEDQCRKPLIEHLKAQKLRAYIPR